MTREISLELEVLPVRLAVCRLAPTDVLPAWASQGAFYSVSKTSDELSIVCDEAHVPVGIKAERGWSAMKVKGPLDFGLTGILASLASPLAEAGISIFAISTFDTDYVLVKQVDTSRTVDVLAKAGHKIAGSR